MLEKKKRPIWILTVFFAVLFAVLLSVRTGIFDRQPVEESLAMFSSTDRFSDRNTWMNIFHNGSKIGFSHSSYTRVDDGFRFKESVFMRINTMGMIQDISLNSDGRLDTDFSLNSFTFSISSGRFNFSARGNVSDNMMTLQTKGGDSQQELNIPLDEKIYFTSGIVQAASAGELKPGDRMTLKVFDPIAMGRESIVLSVLEEEEILVMGNPMMATKISLDFKGSSQLAWIDKNGDILKETGMLGISLEKSTREDAMYGLPIQSSQDLTKAASIPSNLDIDSPMALKRLKARIQGLENKTVDLNGGRQTFVNGILFVHRESLQDLPTDFDWKKHRWSKNPFLKASPFIQSNHPAIIKLATDITDETDSPLEKARKMMRWIEKNIKKRPVLSLPDAISTLENRMGDCNEHAVLFAALARAVHIPAKVEAGVVYLNGRFYYHAWNLIHVGRWITADALFKQIPADVTHIRLASGAQEDQLDILGLIGKLNITILEGTE